jgi:hypothetical protein
MFVTQTVAFAWDAGKRELRLMAASWLHKILFAGQEACD